MITLVDLSALFAAFAAGVLVFRNYSGLKASAQEGPESLATAASTRTSSDDRHVGLNWLGVLAVLDFEEVARRIRQKGDARAQMALACVFPLASLPTLLLPRIIGFPWPAVPSAFAVGLGGAALVGIVYRAWWGRGPTRKLINHTWFAWLEFHVVDPLMESPNASFDVVRWIDACPPPELQKWMDERYRDHDLKWQVDEESMQRRREAIERRTAEIAQSSGYRFRSREWQRWQEEALRTGTKGEEKAA